MISLIRSFFQSKLGIGLTLGFLAIIAIAFAASDITGSNFGGVAGGDRAATVGDQAIGTAALSQAVSNAFEGARQQNPTLTMQRFVATGAIASVLDGMIDRSALYAFGRKEGLAASDALIGSELAKIPAFLGPDGNFNQQQYQQVLSQQRLTDAQVREDIAQGLVAKQVLVPVSFGAVAPRELGLRYGQLSRERRKGAIALIPADAFAPAAGPDEATLAAYYRANAARYIVPERRTIRYASFGEEAVKGGRGPTEAEIQQAYAAGKAKYAASETRTIVQVIVPTEPAAKALAAEVAGGKSLDAAARAKGLLPSQAAVTREQLTERASAAVAQAVFAAGRGSVATPARGGLGWYVIKIDGITQNAGKTLDQARAEIVTQLQEKLRRDALSDLTARVEEQIDAGGNLADVAKDLGATPQTTAPLTADGKLFGKAGEAAPAEIARLIPTAFLMEREGQPQLAELVPGKTFVVFEVADIAPAAPPPLAQVRDRAVADWKRQQGVAAAKAASDRVLAALNKGQAMPAALRTAGVTAGQVDMIDATRQDIVALGAKAGRVPPSLALLFSMAERTSKRLQAPGDAGWFVLRLDDIEPGKLAANDPVIASLQRELGQLNGREYADQFRRALRTEVGVKRNAGALRTVRERLVGSGN